jgi:C4-dicarboxylate-specific signal transduction histidine kinase
MNHTPHTAEEENLRFFGKISASISHEIKNVMAIINEKAGLLKDLTLMAQKGMALDVLRIQSIADDLRTQIKRGDAIIRNMNKFAHSVDEKTAEVNLSEVTGLMVLLSERFASKHGVTLIAPIPQAGPVIRTRPFLLEQLIWQCLQALMERCGDDKTIALEAAPSDPGVQIRFLVRDKGAWESFPLDSVSWILKILHAEVRGLNGGSGLVVSLPRDISIQAD